MLHHQKWNNMHLKYSTVWRRYKEDGTCSYSHAYNSSIYARNQLFIIFQFLSKKLTFSTFQATNGDYGGKNLRSEFSMPSVSRKYFGFTLQCLVEHPRLEEVITVSETLNITCKSDIYHRVSVPFFFWS